MNLNFNNVDNIISSFHKMVEKLETINKRELEAASKHKEAIENLSIKVDACVKEAERASRIAKNIIELVK